MTCAIKRRLLRQSFWALGLLLLAAALSAQAPAPEAADVSADVPPEETAPSLPVRFGVELDRREITVGGRVKATLTLVWMGAKPTAPARFPTWQETWGGAEVLESGPVKAFVDQSGRYIYRQELRLTAFEVGEVRLPSIEVALSLSDHTVDLSTEVTTTFEVISVLPPEPEVPAGPPGRTVPGGTAPGAPPDGAAPDPPELLPAAPPQPLPSLPLYWWTTALLALACVLATLAVDRRLRYLPGEGQTPKAMLPPYDEFVKRLAELDPTDAEPAHTALSLGLRRYLGRRLEFQAAESTTSEIQRRLRDTPVAAAGAPPLVRLFRSCDQVKFARQQVAPEVTRQRMRQAHQLAKELEERLRPEPEKPADSAYDSTSPAPFPGRAA